MRDETQDIKTTHTEKTATDGAAAPFLVRRERREERGSHFTPAAVLLLTPALRTSGLWRSVPPPEFKDLLLLLTFLTPDGRVRPTLVELTQAMGVSEARARARLRRLADCAWRGEPLVRRIARGSGLDAWAPAETLLAVSDAPAGLSGPENGYFYHGPDAGIRPAGRQAVLEHSRVRYARSREQVEADIARRMGWAPPDFKEDDPEAAARKRAAYERMTDLGVPRDQALDLLGRFSLDEIERQLDWLPYRQAKSPGRLLVAAVEGGYAPPAALKQPATLLPDRPEPGSEKIPTAPDPAADADRPPSGEHEPPQDYELPEEHALEDLEWDLTGEDTDTGEEGPW